MCQTILGAGDTAVSKTGLTTTCSYILINLFMQWVIHLHMNFCFIPIDTETLGKRMWFPSPSSQSSLTFAYNV